VKFSVCPSIRLNSRESSPLGVNEGVNIPPRGEVHTWGPGEKLRMALWSPGGDGRKDRFGTFKKC
jgi:hypothetical protein